HEAPLSRLVSKYLVPESILQWSRSQSQSGVGPSDSDCNKTASDPQVVDSVSRNCPARPDSVAESFLLERHVHPRELAFERVLWRTLEPATRDRRDGRHTRSVEGLQSMERMSGWPMWFQRRSWCVAQPVDAGDPT